MQAQQRNLEQIKRLEVPIVVILAERIMRVSEFMAIAPGAIVELPKTAEAELDLLVNNRVIGSGTAVKVGENFGLRISYVGDAATRLEAVTEEPGTVDDAEADALAAAMLAGQL
ncbi:MAG: FliM/FliN family flagellar motor switch protein [Phycisphaerales bacterium]|jgi:flagellar motor switch protein FliN/FliY